MESVQFPRSEELNRRNRRVGWIAAWIAIALLIGSIIYVVFFGGSNMGPMQPLHSSIVTSTSLLNG